MEHANKKRKVDEAKDSFVALFPNLLEELVADIHEKYPDFDEGAIQWFKEVQHGDKTSHSRALSTTAWVAR